VRCELEGQVALCLQMNQQMCFYTSILACMNASVILTLITSCHLSNFIGENADPFFDVIPEQLYQSKKCQDLKFKLFL